jgi:hypothetical protein
LVFLASDPIIGADGDECARGRHFSTTRPHQRSRGAVLEGQGPHGGWRGGRRALAAHGLSVKTVRNESAAITTRALMGAHCPGKRRNVVFEASRAFSRPVGPLRLNVCLAGRLRSMSKAASPSLQTSSPAGPEQGTFLPLSRRCSGYAAARRAVHDPRDIQFFLTPAIYK